MTALPRLLLLALAPLAAGVVVVTYQDAALTHYPARAVVVEELRAARIPFIHPGASCGQPLAGNPNFGVFFPDTLLAVLLPLPVGFGLRFALAAALAFLGARRWARAEGASGDAALVAGLAFVLSGVYVSTWRFFNSGLALALAPWVLAAARKLGARATQGGPPLRRAVAELGLLAGLEILAGEPVVALLTFTLAAARVLAFHAAEARPRRGARRLLAAALGGFALAALVGAPQIAATAQILADSSRERRPIPFVTAAGTSVHPARLLEQAVPFPHGRPDLRGADGFFGHERFDGHAPYLWTLHIGLPVLGLLVLHGPTRGARAAFFSGAVLVAVVLSLGKYLPLAKALYPGLSLGGRIRFPVKWWYVAALALVPLVGSAAQAWLAGSPSGRARRFVFAALGLAVLAGLAAAWPLTPLAAAGPALSLAGCAVLVTGRRRAARLAFAVAASLGLCVAPLLLALLDTPPAAPPRLSNGRIYSRIEAADAHPRPDVAAHEPGPVRAFFRRASPELWPLTGTREGMGYAFDHDPDGAYADDDRALRKAVDARPWPERADALRAAGVDTVVTDALLGPPYRERAVLDARRGVRAYGLADVAPSLRVATRVFRAPDLAGVMAAHDAPDFDPASDVVLAGAAESPRALAPRGRVLSREETPAALRAEVEAPGPAVVVWSRTYFGAWRARVDGSRAPTLKADGHLVAVLVGPGRHRVEIDWDARPVYAGLGLALVGLLTAAVLRRS